MARVRIKWLKNRGARIYSHRSGEQRARWHYVPGNGRVTILEACAVLKTYDMRLYRMIRERRLRVAPGYGLIVPLTELRRLAHDRAWRQRRPPGKAA